MPLFDIYEQKNIEEQEDANNVSWRRCTISLALAGKNLFNTESPCNQKYVQIIFTMLACLFLSISMFGFLKKILQCDDNKKALICLLHFGSAHQSLQLYLMKESRVSSAEIALTLQNFRFI